MSTPRRFRRGAYAERFVKELEEHLAKKSSKFYADAQEQHDPRKRKGMLSEVASCMELHDILREKLIELGIRSADDDADTALVAEIKRKISEDLAITLKLLSRPTTCDPEMIAERSHTIYVTATDLAEDTILQHAEDVSWSDATCGPLLV